MKLTKTIGLATVGMMLPLTITAVSNSAIASEVKTTNIEAITRRDGSIYLKSGETTLQVPSRRDRYWNPWRYWRLPWQNYSRDRQSSSKSNRSHCRQSSYQSTSQVTNSSRRIIHNSISSHTCN